ncbi:MAG: aldo/keto reductase [Porphyromonadaceae bacterium]|nr:aldo/keto reductase [Porphyromonadaceae bacterium]
MLSNRIQEAFEGSLSNLGLDYVDLYLVHWPVKGKLGFTWQAMEQIFHSGRARSIGLSNHLVHHISAYNRRDEQNRRIKQGLSYRNSSR